MHLWPQMRKNHPHRNAVVGGFLLVEAQPQSPETQDKSCGHAILQIAICGTLIAAPLLFLSRIPKLPYSESYRRWLLQSVIPASSLGLFYSLNTWISSGSSAPHILFAGSDKLGVFLILDRQNTSWLLCAGEYPFHDP